jgi:hypothetical protein
MQLLMFGKVETSLKSPVSIIISHNKALILQYHTRLYSFVVRTCASDIYAHFIMADINAGDYTFR